jgi:effector-binding domain-containing protein
MNPLLLWLILWPVPHLQNTSADISKVTITDAKIAQTPALKAICLSGEGNGAEYEKAVNKLGEYLVSKNIKPGPIFSTEWKAGPDAATPDAGAHWNACAETTLAKDDIPLPFVFKDIEPQEAGHILCDSDPENIGACFAAVIDLVTKSERIPSAPPRYSVAKENGAGKPTTYEVWLPLSPKAATAAAPHI